MGSNKITSVANPTLAQDAATKAYVDAALPSTTGLLLNSNNLSDVSNTTTARTNLGLGSIATQAASAVAITGGSITGITDLTVADGGTGVSTLSANAVLLGNGTSALQTVAPGTSGNVLTSNGTTWTSATPATAVTSINGQTGAVVDTSTNAIGSYVVGGRQNSASPLTGWTFGTTYAGSLIYYQAASSVFSSQYSDRASISYGLSGTWRAMCHGAAGEDFGCGFQVYECVLFVRVS
jgi:hypothetical protein